MTDVVDAGMTSEVNAGMTGEVEAENYILAQANLRLAQRSAPQMEK